MVYRKGELSTKTIDRDYPYQVALLAERTLGGEYIRARLFADGLSLAPRGHTFRRGDQLFNVWCFAEQTDAEAFASKFGGAIIAPKDRPKWPG